MAFKQDWHEREHSSLEVTMSGLVINPEYSCLGASLDSVVHGSGCTDPNGVLKIKCPYNYRDSIPFQAASQKGFCCRLEKGKLVLREHHHYIIIIRSKADGYLLWKVVRLCGFLQMLGFLSSGYFLVKYILDFYGLKVKMF